MRVWIFMDSYMDFHGFAYGFPACNVFRKLEFSACNVFIDLHLAGFGFGAQCVETEIIIEFLTLP
jgi:hypothetical protein